jgi:hypothetical protein
MPAENREKRSMSKLAMGDDMIDDVDDLDDIEDTGADDVDQDEDGDEDDDFSEDDDEPEDGDEDGSDEDDEDEDGDEDEDEEDEEGLSHGAQTRIRKLNAQKKEALAQVSRLKKQLESAKRLSGDDGKAIMSAASATGILPQLMTSREADAFKKLEQLPVVIENYEDWLDTHDSDDELDVGDGQTMSYGDIKKRVRKLKAQKEELEEEFGERRSLLKKKVRKILQLGLEAYRNGGKKPKKAAEKKGKAKKDERRRSADDYPRGKKPRTPAGKKKVRNYGDVESTEDLVRMLAKE